MKKCYHFLFLICFIPITYPAFSQQQNIPLGGNFQFYYQKTADLKSNHSAVRPFLESDLFDSTAINNPDTNPNLGEMKRIKNRAWFARKLLYENFLIVDTNDFYLTIDPLFDFSVGRFDTKSKSDTSDYSTMNMRGIAIRGDIGKKFSFSSFFYENQALFAPYVTKYAQTHTEWNLANGIYQQNHYYTLVPGKGKAKPFHTNGHDYGYANASISYSPTQNLNFQFGNEKSFIGYGYRSLLLSDVAFNYPNFKTRIDFRKHKLRYTLIYAEMQDLYRMPFETSAEALYYRKAATFHYLDWAVTKNLNIGLFESGIYPIMDSIGSIPFNANILEPLPLVNSAIYGLNANDNMRLGLNIQYIFSFKTAIYGQIVANDNQFKHTGFQLGAKYYGLKNFFVQLEYNATNPFTQAEVYGFNNFTQYNEPLGFIAGNNAQEFLVRANWMHKRFFVNVEANMINRFANSQNVFAKSTSIYPEDGSQTINTRLTAGFLVNKRNNMNLYISFVHRNYDGTDKTTTNWFQFGFRTDLTHFYTDF